MTSTADPTAATAATAATVASATSAAAEAALREELVRRRFAGLAGGRRGRIAVADRSGPLPLSHGQQQLWFLNRREPDSPEYLVPAVLRLRGPVDAAALAVAWAALVGAHEILRTRYALDGA
ncbi:MAG TPA: condensation domain-containing protein, partial [Pseudonocardiaceae bacterium]